CGDGGNPAGGIGRLPPFPLRGRRAGPGREQHPPGGRGVQFSAQRRRQLLEFERRSGSRSSPPPQLDPPVDFVTYYCPESGRRIWFVDFFEKIVRIGCGRWHSLCVRSGKNEKPI